MLLQDLQTPGHLIQELPPASAGQAVHKPFAVSLASLKQSQPATYMLWQATSHLKWAKNGLTCGKVKELSAGPLLLVNREPNGNIETLLLCVHSICPPQDDEMWFNFAKTASHFLCLKTMPDHSCRPRCHSCRPSPRRRWCSALPQRCRIAAGLLLLTGGVSWQQSMHAAAPCGPCMGRTC